MLETAIAIVALLWTVFQQYQISKMCSECQIRKDFYNSNFKPLTEKEIKKIIN